MLGNTWWKLLIAAFEAVMFGQIALVAHDLAHRQVFRTRTPTEIRGRIAGDICIGLGYGWWMKNILGTTPIRIMRWPVADFPALLANGKPFCFSMLAMEGLNLHSSSIRSLFRPALKHRMIEAGGAVLVDTALGGLNYQIEHHLFPSMPAAHLRRAQPIVRQYCAELGLPYHEASLFGSWTEALRHLHRVGVALRTPPHG